MSNTIAIDEKKQQRDSLSISLILHFFLVLLLLFPIVSALSKEPEKPQFEGIQVALGYKEATQRTKTQPAPSASSAKPTPKQKSKAAPAKSAPKKSQAIAKPVSKKIVSETLTKVAPVVATKEKVVQTESDAKAKAEKQKEAAEEAERKAAEAKAKAEAEAKQKAAEEAKRKAEAELAAKKAAARSKFNNLAKSANGNGAPSKGDPSGHPDATALEGITKGKGKAGNGLGSRGLLFAPVISDSSQQTGRVVVNICVNAQGKVISADFTQKGSTTTDSHLISLAVSNAKKYKFSESSTAEQCGDITIDFKLK